MRTQCPACKSVFRVTHQQLSAAGGRVRCGQCETVFDGNENIRYTRPPSLVAAPAQTVRSANDTPAEPDKRRLHGDVQPAPPLSEESTRSTDATPHLSRDGEPRESPAVPDVFFSGSRTGGKRRAGRYALIGTIVFVLLLAGYAYLERERLARQPVFADWMTRACRYIGCEAPAFRAPEQITIIDRNIASRPTRRDTLLVTATLINEAPRAQPYPRMRVSLTDLQGTVMAVNRFEPADYLPRGVSPEAPMPRARNVDIRVEIPDPGVEAVAFEFSFY